MKIHSVVITGMKVTFCKKRILVLKTQKRHNFLRKYIYNYEWNVDKYDI